MPHLRRTSRRLNAFRENEVMRADIPEMVDNPITGLPMIDGSGLPTDTDGKADLMGAWLQKASLREAQLQLLGCTMIPDSMRRLSTLETPLHY